MGSSSSPAKHKAKRAEAASASAPTASASGSNCSSSSSSLPASVSGFTVLPIAYSASATHVIYARAHSAPKQKNGKGKGKEKTAALPEGRTVFLVNVPPDATERELTVLFKSCGTVERVVFSTGGSGIASQPEEVIENDEDSEDEEQGEDGAESQGEEDEEADSRPKKKRKVAEPEGPKVVPLPSHSLRTLRRTGHTAYVVFLDSSSLERALKPPQKPYAWPVDKEAPHGLAHYTALYSALRPPLDVVRAHADSWMEAFEHEQAKKKQESKYRKGEAIVDEDGFTLVTRGGAYGKTLGGGVGVASKQFQEEQAGGTGSKRRRKEKKEKKEKEAFYAFQIHEKKRKELIDLKAKFEEDRAKIEKLRQTRKFKPY
ncbi:ribosomal RNA-processing protein 7-domain-containing protein [Cubamyces menziesii]|nr:ribosomal RNA-processing protein 7-domain-containing protein [Cubamyces menziesii]